jgi:protein phosphatase
MSQQQKPTDDSAGSTHSSVAAADSLQQKPASQASFQTSQTDLKLAYGSFSSAGIKPENDDTLAVYIPEEPLLTSKGAVFLIADGVSTAEKGREASQICGADFIKEYYHTPELWSVKTSAHNTLIALNRKLYANNRQFSVASRGYASTLSLLVIKSHSAHIFHVGDSRIYLLRDDKLELMTTDHSERSQNSFALTRAMGIDVTLQVDYRKLDLQENDLFLFSTDGIHDFLSLQEMQKVLASCEDNYEDCCRQLADMALAAKSNDNLSCLLFRATDLAAKDADDMQNLVTVLPFPPPLSIGHKLDGYRVIKEIHASSRSQVYLVEDEDSGERLAMKTPSLNYQDDQAYIDRFCLEEWVGRRIESDNVVRFFRPQRHKTFLYYLMEYVEGDSLQGWNAKNRGQLPRGGQVLKITRQIVAGLEALHEKEIIHRDLKPDNIMIDRQGCVKIVDLGSVYVASIDEIQTCIDHDELLGTINYTAPEYRLGQKANAKMDQFSLGTIVYEMLTHNFPYGHSLQKCQKEKDFRRLRYTLSFKYNEQIPLWFDGALKRATEIDAAKRYDSIGELLDDLAHPNPDYLTKEYISKLEETLPTINIAMALSLIWAGSLLLAVLVFVI